MKKNFEIRIPKYLLKQDTPYIEKLDFVFTFLVSYWYTDGKLMITVEHALDLGTYIDWDNPRLSQYITAACENNYLNTGLENGDLLDELAPTLNRQ